MDSQVIIFEINASSRIAIRKKIRQQLWLQLLLPVSKEYCKTFCSTSRICPVTASRRPNDKYPVNTSHHSRFVYKCFTAVLFGIDSNSYTVNTQSHVYIHTHTHTLFTIQRRWYGKRNFKKLGLWHTIMGDGIPVKHRDTTKTAEQNSQTGDQRTTVRAQPGTPH